MLRSHRPDGTAARRLTSALPEALDFPQRAAYARCVMSPRLLAHLSMLAFSAFIAGSFTLGALAVPYLAPAPLNAVRFMLAVLLMGAWTFGVQRQKFMAPAQPWRFAITGFLTAIYFVTMFIALSMTLPVATSAVYTLVPIMTAVTAYFLIGQRAGPLVLLSLLIAGLGAIWVIFRADLDALLRFDVGPGELIYFVGCVAYAFYAPLLRRFQRGEPATVLSFWTLSGTAAWLILYAIPQILTVDWLAVPPLVWWVILYLAVLPTAVAFFLIQYASRHLPSAKVTAYGYLTPAFVILFEGIAGHGWPSLGVVAGALLTVFGLVVLARVPDR